MTYNGTTLICCVAAILFGAAGFRLTVVGKPTDAGTRKVADPVLRVGDGVLAPSAQMPGWPRNLFSLAPPMGNDTTGSIKTDATSIEQKLPTLVGVITDSDQRLAIINDNGKIRRVREADEIGIWTVSRIEMRAALLRHGDQLHELLLDPPALKK